jgi:hypothetical protein
MKLLDHFIFALYWLIVILSLVAIVHGSKDESTGILTQSRATPDLSVHEDAPVTK